MSGYEALDDASGRPLTGRRTLGIAAACFGVIFAVNGYMAYSAVSTFTGETEASPYEHGLAYREGHRRRQGAGGAGLERLRACGARR